MLDFLEPLKEEKFDFITFFEGEKVDSISVMGQFYNEPGEPVGGSSLGDSYHIILFKSHKTEDKYVDLDNFEAILADPLEYMSGLIPSGFYGVIARKTTTSDGIIQRLLDFCSEKM
jgi:hypothetical protein